MFRLVLAPVENLIVLSLLQRSQSMRCRRETTILHCRVPAYAYATPSHIHSSVHVKDARDQIGSGTIGLFSSQLPGIMYLPLAGRTMRPTAR